MKILVCGAGGFIGSHLVSSLKNKDHYVIGADLKYPEFEKTKADVFHICDLRSQEQVKNLLTSDIDEIYQLAADMGGIGYISIGVNDADIMHNSATINLNILDEMVRKGIKKVFYSSSACVYPEYNQLDPQNPLCTESSAYPAEPDTEYGWEKLFSERLYMTYARTCGIHVRIARFHNIYGPNGTWQGGKEKAPAALCRKIAESKNGDSIDVWGSGNQTRSFLYIDECISGIHKLMSSDFDKPINLGSTRMISINDFVHLIAKVANKEIKIKNIAGPTGVSGRNSDNTLIREVLNWAPDENLEYGIKLTYNWILDQIESCK